jgi:hypothetical protein
VRLAAALLIVTGAGACAPWYRDDLERAQAAHDPAASTKLTTDADAAAKAGRPGEAADLLYEQILRDPAHGDFVAFASAATRAGRGDEARAALRWKRRQPGGDDAPTRRALIDSLVADDLVADALDLFATLDEAAADPALAPPLGELAAATRSRWSGTPYARSHVR